ncbi:MAG TPA: hypothetical protein VFU80_04010, partial [Sphingomicrobium sp.]|nr:hypothetical protein [Sphingomicrobium sp.]
MPDAVFADPAERLPWLPNIAPPPQPKRSTGKAVGLAGWAVAGALLIAGASYWLGTQSGKQPGTGGTVASSASGPDATLKLPEPRANVQPQVSIPHAPEVRPAPAPTVAVPESAPNQHKRPRLKREEPSTAKLDQAVKVQSDKPAAAPAKSPPVAAAKPQPLKLWPSRQVTGSSGRLVQIGAFGTRHQAKLGWRHMQRAYPAIGKL